MRAHLEKPKFISRYSELTASTRGHRTLIRAAQGILNHNRRQDNLLPLGSKAQRCLAGCRGDRGARIFQIGDELINRPASAEDPR